MDFDELMQQMQPGPDTWTAIIPEDWLQGRSAYGGLQVSLALKAMRALLPTEVPLRTLQVTFLAPVPPGPVEITAHVLRAGKSATHVEARLQMAGQTLCLVIGVFGLSRASSVNILPVQPAVTVDEKPLQLRYVEGITPVFLQHFDMRWLSGSRPFQGASTARAVIEVGLHSAADRKASDLHLTAIADAIPPLALAMLHKPAPASSMTWMLELLSDRYDHQPLNGWRFDAEVLAAGQGYTSQTVMIWAPDGSPAALSRQSMVVFA